MGLPCDRPTPLEDSTLVFARVGHELANLAILTDGLQDSLGRALAIEEGSANLDAQTLQSLQNLDLLTQTLDALGAFMTKLGQDSATNGGVDLAGALGIVTLSGLAGRLAGRSDAQESDMEFDLF